VFVDKPEYTQARDTIVRELAAIKAPFERCAQLLVKYNASLASSPQEKGFRPSGKVQWAIRTKEGTQIFRTAIDHHLDSLQFLYQ
jgi:hypothetical protein